MPLAPEFIESVANTNMKVLAETGAFAMGLAFQDSVDVQRASRAILTAATSAAVKQLVEPDIAEAAAINKVATGNDLAGQIAQLLAAISAGGQQAKIVYATPPSNEK